MFRMTATYPAGDDATFDFDYYTSSHVPMIAGFIGDDCVKWEVSKGLSNGGPGAAPYVAIGQFWLTSLDGLNAAFAEHGREMMGDVKNFTNIRGLFQVEEIVATPATV